MYFRRKICFELFNPCVEQSAHGYVPYVSRRRRRPRCLVLILNRVAVLGRLRHSMHHPPPTSLSIRHDRAIVSRICVLLSKAFLHHVTCHSGRPRFVVRLLNWEEMLGRFRPACTNLSPKSFSARLYTTIMIAICVSQTCFFLSRFAFSGPTYVLSNRCVSMCPMLANAGGDPDVEC